ncbi:MAG: UDP-N-acetylmuramoyl-L-alanyl-D-glutamate--2,6-diaminopimelate ligase [Rhodobacteraceae bacterium]|nr:UDP-N-acetylmuramoyl-L-alanyl-D-glutamate--2,6-diaminopimelate ligase [Paracoccaceae bacterium]
MTKSLCQLALTARAGRDPVLTGLAVDSREVRDGYLFAALPGSRVHGGSFIQCALRQGAAAILTDGDGARIAERELAQSGAAVILSDDPRRTLACTAARWFGYQPETIVAVTGTNGKTSVASFVRQIWTELGHAAVNLGTTGVEGAWTTPLNHTTPEPITLHRALAGAVQAGVTHAALEASSHGLDQRRLDGLHLAAAAFSNFTRDHLDYHETPEAYFAAKARLFRRLLPQTGVAVINIDDPRGPEMRAIAAARGQTVLTVGQETGDITRLARRFDASGQDLRFAHRGKTYQARLNLIGGFQGENVLLACGLAIATGDLPEHVFHTLPHLKTIRGRMQLVATRDNGATVFVDYAHTPAAVASATRALRPHVMGRLVAIVGAGGDRDPGKRPLMGAAAAAHADQVIITDDNPRNENPATIRAAILQGAPDATEIGDRAKAILYGVDALDSGDALLICGKGHETGQHIGDDVLPFDDAEQASIAVAALNGRSA